MKTVKQVMAALKKCGSEQTRKTYIKHGAPDDIFGVKVADLKVIGKQIKGNQSLACDLYATGNSDAMYLAGLVVDGGQLTKRELQAWVKAAGWTWLSEYTVPWVAAESAYGRDLALKWIDAKQESIACSGWNTYAGIMAMTEDDDLDLDEIRALLNRVVSEIDTAANRVRFTMNGFVIAVGSYVKPLLKDAKRAAKAIGVVSVDVGDTACRVPLATQVIQKAETAGRVGKKRKTVKC